MRDRLVGDRCDLLEQPLALRAADVEPGPAGSDPDDLVRWGDALYFSAWRPATGRELYSYHLPMFADGFETGDSTSWSSTTP